MSDAVAPAPETSATKDGDPDAENGTRPVMGISDTPPVIRLPCCPRPFQAIELKSLCPDRAKVITETEECRKLVSRLVKEKVVGLAVEGINVGKEGPLTLLQIGTCSGHVYIFDVLENRDLVIKGRLKQLLEDNSVQKVTHDCSAASAALEHQFATSLCNVFDTQVAHLVISRHQGRRLPVPLSLSELVIQYARDPEKLCIFDWRTDAKGIWMSMLGNFWAMRPLTSDMVEYAACDVIVLIPDVYRHQSDYIHKYKLGAKFQKEVNMWLHMESDYLMKEKYGKQVSNEVTAVLLEMDSKYDDRVQLFNILNEDEMNALTLATYEDTGNVSQRIQRFKTSLIIRQLDGIEVAMRTDIEAWQQQKGNILDYLRYYQEIPQDEIRQKSTQIYHNIVKSVLEHIEEKYHITTLPNMLTLCEKNCILTIPYSDVMSGKAGEVTTQLFWGLMHEEIHGMINCLRFSPSQFFLTEEEYTKVSCFAHDASGSVPEEVASLAMGLIHALRAYSASTATYTIQDKRCKSARV